MCPIMSPDKGQKDKETFCCEICMLAFKQMKDAMQALFYFDQSTKFEIHENFQLYGTANNYYSCIIDRKWVLRIQNSDCESSGCGLYFDLYVFGLYVGVVYTCGHSLWYDDFINKNFFQQWRKLGARGVNVQNK